MAKRIAEQKEMPAYTGFSKWAIAEMTRRGTIPAFQLPGINRWYYDLDIIDTWISNLSRNDSLKVI